MALRTCPECRAAVSDKAPACPSCGHPMASAAIVTTQQTGKRFKGAQLLGVLLCAAGTVSCVANEVGAMAGLWFIGLAVYTVARFGAWWSHG